MSEDTLENNEDHSKADVESTTSSSIDEALLQAIPVTLTVELGSTKIRLKDLLRLTQGSVLELNTEAGAMLDLKVNDTVIAKGEVVTVADQIGLNIVEIVSPMDRIKPV